MLVFDAVSKSYPGPEGPVPVFDCLSFTLCSGDLAVIRGPSGCGKSTLLFTAGAMLKPDRGTVRLGDHPLYQLGPSRRNAIRGTAVGFVFQRFHLVPYMSVAENILWPLRWSKAPGHCLEQLEELAERLRIQRRLRHLPSQLSAGEQQRVAVARALIGGKQLICADEPTGNLDQANSAVVMETLREEAARGRIVLLATHHSPDPGFGNVSLDWRGEGPELSRQDASSAG